MIWDPVFSPESGKVASKAERNGTFCLVLDGKAGDTEYEAVWDPVFSPDGEKILVRGIRDGKYYRKVIPVREL